MAHSVKSVFTISALLCLTMALSGCAMMGFAVPAAVSGCALDVNYTFTNIAYKTICYPFTDVEVALSEVLQKMNIKEKERKSEDSKISVLAIAGNRDIYIDLEKVTPTVTSMTVDAKKGVFLKDKATATEIIVQTEKFAEAMSNPTTSVTN